MTHIAQLNQHVKHTWHHGLHSELTNTLIQQLFLSNLPETLYLPLVHVSAHDSVNCVIIAVQNTYPLNAAPHPSICSSNRLARFFREFWTRAD